MLGEYSDDRRIAESEGKEQKKREERLPTSGERSEILLDCTVEPS